MRKTVLALLAFVASCSPPEVVDSDERWSALHAATEPARTVALAAVWYENENGHWPSTLADVADLSEELGHSSREPPEPIPIPTAGEFHKIRFEVHGDSLFRLHFAHAPFRSAAVAAFADSPARPAVEVRESRGLIDVSAGRIGIDRASVTVEGGKRYESVGDTLVFEEVVLLRPIPREGYPLR